MDKERDAGMKGAKRMFSRLLRQLIRVAADRRGGVSVMLALMLVPLVAVMGLATETASWYFFQRAAQNAADAAALAAAANNCATASVCGTATYADEARAVSKRYNFTHGADNTTVVALNNQACPSPSTETNCYKVTVTRDLPIYLTRVVGFGGTSGVTVNGGPAQRIVAVAMAKPRASGEGYCMMTLNHGNVTTSFTSNGGSSANMGLCDSFVTGNANCNGHDLNIDVSTATGTNDTCGKSEVEGAAPISDPYAYLGTSTNIPTNGVCQNGIFGGSVNLSSYDATHPYTVCGNLTIGTLDKNNKGNCTDATVGDVNVSTAGAAGSVIIIKGGNLVLNCQLKATGLTIIFSGTAGGAAGFVTSPCKGNNCNSVLDYAAPISGTWSGVAMYQDPRLTTATNSVYTGNSPAFKITGLLYLPYANLTISGAINHQTNGNQCISIITDKMTISGTGSFFANTTSQCAQSGLTLPAAANSGARQALVQ
jgi:Flp pilus assembly protein TadG